MDNMTDMENMPTVNHMTEIDHKRPPLSIYDTQMPSID